MSIGTFHRTNYIASSDLKFGFLCYLLALYYNWKMTSVVILDFCNADNFGLSEDGFTKLNDILEAELLSISSYLINIRSRAA